MLDFTELPKEGGRFEQLVREIALIRGMRPHWTGKGPDSGRDLLIEEPLTGAIQNQTRLWLVDCKHYAHSGGAVGVSDVRDIRDRCERVGAAGFLLACSTVPSSELTRKLRELQHQSKIACEVWDASTIERYLTNPRTYYVAQRFFTKSMSDPAWRVFYTEREERWMAHFKGHFMYLESRAGIEPMSLRDVEIFIHELENVDLGDNEQLRIRSVWHDTPNGPFYDVAADYLVPSNKLPLRSPRDIGIQLNEYCIDGGCVTWYVTMQITIPQSDYYSPDDPFYYRTFRQPLFNSFYQMGEIATLDGFSEWPNKRPPPIRTFSDQLIWEKDKGKFGYKSIGETVTTKL